MHIPYREDIIGLEFAKTSFSEKIWQFIRFCVVTGLIFTISFFILNFSAYRQIFSDLVNPGAQVHAQEVLGGAAGEGRASSSLLLPLLPDKKDTTTTYSWLDLPIVPTDDRLVVPKIGKSVPLVHMDTNSIQGQNWNELEKQIQSGLKQGVVHYPGTAKPGQYGNVFMTGHSSYYPWDSGKFKDVFAQLGKLDVGDRYYVYYSQKKYAYEIISKKEVNPNNVDVLKQPVDQKISTLMTCTPVGTTLRRLIITAKQV